MNYLHNGILYGVGIENTKRIEPIPWAWKMANWGWFDRKQWLKYKASLPKEETKSVTPAKIAIKININRKPSSKKEAPINQSKLFA